MMKAERLFRVAVMSLFAAAGCGNSGSSPTAGQALPEPVPGGPAGTGGSGGSGPVSVCKAGDKKECTIVLRTDPVTGIEDCAEGEQLCTNGKWSACQGLATIPDGGSTSDGAVSQRQTVQPRNQASNGQQGTVPKPDYGPTPKVEYGGSSPSTSPPATQTNQAPTYCKVDQILLDSTKFHATGPTTAFGKAWATETAKVTGGVLTIDVAMSTPVHMSVASTASGVPGPGTGTVLVDSTTRMVALQGNGTPFTLRVGTTDIPIAQFGFTGVLTSTCDDFQNAMLSLLVPVSEGSIAFGSSTLSALLQQPDDGEVTSDGKPAWRIDLTYVGVQSAPSGPPVPSGAPSGGSLPPNMPRPQGILPQGNR